MSGKRFQTLIDYHQRQEDELRGKMVQVDARMANIRADQAQLQNQRESAAASVPLGFYEEFLAFSRLCDDRQATFARELEQLTEHRAQVQNELVAQWRRRRSLETLQRRYLAQQQRRQERRNDAELLDSTVRAWYLRQENHEHPQETGHSSLSSDYTEVLL
ncbi:MAG: hypothetical protein EA401_05335 [Planctomycetota bacterium]|nr:MAG: hypothetical protein EA401_05335 [Planctomycetota bacterium]